ncbi:MAG: PatB family C-S lyase [Pseudomonadales bacterium]|mgnify:CR=1 FL=1|nr:PatB family C-S lyase [Pseudomonadales bacterium]|tara:strand:+ start:36985 stop:38130 length:1146 start_codon:yes stop_codon:yes gene_type:complete
MIDFDTVLNRRDTDSGKWARYAGTNILPMWVADMDFKAPLEIINGMKERADHGIFGYASPPPELPGVIIERMARMYNWQVHEDEIQFLPGVVPGLNIASRGLVSPGESIITATPIYYPFLSAPDNWGLKLHRIRAGNTGGEWSFPQDELESTLADNPDIKLLLLCNPFNPIGRLLNKKELKRIIETCLKYDVLICSDEIHCDLLFDDRKHVPTASISSEAADITVTLMAPTKTFNLAGVGGSVAITKNPDIRERFMEARKGTLVGVNVFAYTSMLIAYRDCESWRQELIGYLQANRDYLADRIKNIPGISMSPVEATYLAWLDVSQLALADAMSFFEDAGVGFSDGAQFDGEGFMRFNFACPRETLIEACDRIENAAISIG